MLSTAQEEAYIEHASGEREYYDLRFDPYQLQSMHEDPANAALITQLSAELANLKGCSSTSCQTAENAPIS